MSSIQKEEVLVDKTALEPVTEFGVFWGKNLFKGLGDKDPIIEHILYKGDTICIAAEPGVGKTVLALQMIANLTTGTSFLDEFIISRPYKVLLLQTEGDRCETMNRFESISKGMPINYENFVHMNIDGICLNTKEGCDKFLEMARLPKMLYDVIMIDPLYTTVKGSLSSDDVATDWIRAKRSIKKEFKGASFVIINHESVKPRIVDGKVMAKSKKDSFGSTFWSADFNYFYTLRVKDNLFTFESGKERNKYIIDKVDMYMLEPEPLMYVLADKDISLKEIQIYKLLKESAIPLDVSSIKKRTDISRATIYRVLAKLLLSTTTKINKVGKGSSTKYSIEKK